MIFIIIKFYDDTDLDNHSDNNILILILLLMLVLILMHIQKRVFFRILALMHQLLHPMTLSREMYFLDIFADLFIQLPCVTISHHGYCAFVIVMTLACDTVYA